MVNPGENGRFGVSAVRVVLRESVCCSLSLDLARKAGSTAGRFKARPGKEIYHTGVDHAATVPSAALGGLSPGRDSCAAGHAGRHRRVVVVVQLGGLVLARPSVR